MAAHATVQSLRSPWARRSLLPPRRRARGHDNGRPWAGLNPFPGSWVVARPVHRRPGTPGGAV